MSLPAGGGSRFDSGCGHMNDNILLPEVEAMTDTWAGEDGYYQWRLSTLAHPNFLRLFLEEQRSIRYATAHLARRSAPAVVYFVQQGDNGPIKIGASRNFAKRLKTLHTHSPIELKVLGTFSGGFALERALHRELADHQLEGEWFTPSPPVFAALARLECSA